MIDYSKKSKEHLFLIFLLGGLFGYIDGNSLNLGSFIGSGLAMMLFSMLIGYIIYYLTKSFNSENDAINENLLDSDLESEELKRTEYRIKEKLRPFKYGIYVALFFLLIAIYDQVSRIVF